MYFNTPEVKEMDFVPMPNAIYRVMVDSLEFKTTKAGTGKYVSAGFHVVEGDYENRKLFHNFNISNPNTTAENIGQSQFKKFLKAIGEDVTKGLDLTTDLKRLVDAVCYADVKSEKGSDGEVRNVVKSFHDQVPSGMATRAPSGQSAALDDIPF